MNDKIMFVWAGTIICLLSVIVFIGIQKENSDKDEVYIDLERSIKQATKLYIKDKKKEPKFNESVIIFTNELESDKYIEDEKIEEYCVDNVIVTGGLLFDRYVVNTNCENIDIEEINE